MQRRYRADTTQLIWVLKSLNLSYQDSFTIASLQWQIIRTLLKLQKEKILPFSVQISRPSLLLQRTEGHTVSPVLLQMRGSQPGPGPHLGVASSSIRDLFCTNCFTLHLSTGRQHRQTHAPAATLGNTKSGPSYTFFCDDDFSSEYQEKKWRHLSCPWPIRCINSYY